MEEECVLKSEDVARTLHVSRSMKRWDIPAVRVCTEHLQHCILQKGYPECNSHRPYAASAITCSFCHLNGFPSLMFSITIL
jgi:hypothetical protein